MSAVESVSRKLQLNNFPHTANSTHVIETLLKLRCHKCMFPLRAQQNCHVNTSKFSRLNLFSLSTLKESEASEQTNAFSAIYKHIKLFLEQHLNIVLTFQINFRLTLTPNTSCAVSAYFWARSGSNVLRKTAGTQFLAPFPRAINRRQAANEGFVR